ncbi:MAG: hypothetical protein A2383_01460 [Candidatus Pacebacteria bacterium RIFOXYB1_FULL_39_46]|nr:MAG: hypothetical protein A2383_01460 [Candidatus Pacebacteria bacterium RIFOXYB1_FULL_39_46]OGJ39058.1 MAG: hypothetical protein A2182_01880 [Candidatus Pacebacteria bacterium RIFOXYA1_FULL_38_18]OGJ40029.1 MAG: hypothetical protein A2582_01405 [Candidatus Pacebacteria bacterium RIFOXYD1_FULL_39_27]OGJ40709.1 MAG: hypothetical protein A2411_00290 [Candidatus Pacebacteria bacterium RIFOXYC1_FULL_39_21]
MSTIISSTTSKDFKNQLVSLASNLDLVSKKNRWTISYDNETDALSFSEDRLPLDTKIHYLDHELAVYLTSQNDIKGLFIEYFTKNFLSHNEDLKKLRVELLKQRKSAKEDIIQVKKTTARLLVEELQENLHDFLVTNLQLTRF